MDQKWWFQGSHDRHSARSCCISNNSVLEASQWCHFAFTTCIGRHQELERAPHMAGISTACKLQPGMYIKCEYAFHLYIYHSCSITFFILICLVLESQASRSQIEYQHIDYLN
jgi:hypothetical protein